MAGQRGGADDAGGSGGCRVICHGLQGGAFVDGGNAEPVPGSGDVAHGGQKKPDAGGGFRFPANRD